MSPFYVFNVFYSFLDFFLHLWLYHQFLNDVVTRLAVIAHFVSVLWGQVNLNFDLCTLKGFRELIMLSGVQVGYINFVRFSLRKLWVQTSHKRDRGLRSARRPVDKQFDRLLYFHRCDMDQDCDSGTRRTYERTSQSIHHVPFIPCLCIQRPCDLWVCPLTSVHVPC